MSSPHKIASRFSGGSASGEAEIWESKRMYVDRASPCFLFVLGFIGGVMLYALFG
jgi:hypothetical protein